jgi:hypothetical protein
MRKGMGKGKGRGYKNLMGRDPRVHSDSAKGRKQPQRIALFPITKLQKPKNYSFYYEGVEIATTKAKNPEEAEKKVNVLNPDNWEVESKTELTEEERKRGDIGYYFSFSGNTIDYRPFNFASNEEEAKKRFVNDLESYGWDED